MIQWTHMVVWGFGLTWHHEVLGMESIYGLVLRTLAGSDLQLDRNKTSRVTFTRTEYRNRELLS